MRSNRQKLTLSQLPTRRSPRFSSATPNAANARDEDAAALALPIHAVENKLPADDNAGVQSLRRSSRFKTNVYKTPSPKTCSSGKSRRKKLVDSTPTRRSPRFSSAPALSSTQVVGSRKRGRFDGGGGDRIDLEDWKKRLRSRGEIKTRQLLALPEPISGSDKLTSTHASKRVDSSVEESGVFSLRCLRSCTVKMLLGEKDIDSAVTKKKKKKLFGELSVAVSGKKSQKSTDLAVMEYPEGSEKGIIRTSQTLIEDNTPESITAETPQEKSVKKSLTESSAVDCLTNKDPSLDKILESQAKRRVESGDGEVSKNNRMNVLKVKDVKNDTVRGIPISNRKMSGQKTLRSCQETKEEIVECCFKGLPIAQEVAEQRWNWRYELKRQRKGDNSWKLNADEEDEIILNVSCHYDQAIVGKTVLSIGDYVHVKGDGDRKHIGKILELFKTTEGEDYCRLQWFFRAEDTVLKDVAASLHDKRRIFISDLMNDNLLDCIISKVNVVRVHPKQSLKSISLKSQSSYYYDMEYCVDYSTFRTLSPEESLEKQRSWLSSELPFKRDLALLDLFCGCGGMSTGLSLGAQISGSNLETKWAVDYNSPACESLRLNHPKTHVRNESAEDFLQLLKEWENLCKVHRRDIEKGDIHTVEEEYQCGDDSSSEEYEVSSLVDICYGDPNDTGNRGIHFKVRWKGYAPDDDTWEPIKGLSNCKGKMEDFVVKGFQSRILPLPGDADVICGGPPCQGISGFNRYRNINSPLSDHRNRQIIVFMDIVEFLQPKYVLMENVVDIIKFDGGSLGRYALSRLVGMSYQSRMGTMASGCYGLPQFRLRIFIWGAHPAASLPRYPLPSHDVILRYGPPLEFGRNLVGYEEGQPRSLEKAMVLKDSISDLPRVGNDESREEMPYDRPPETDFQRHIRVGCRVLTDHRPLQLSEHEHLRVSYIPRRKGANFRDLPGVVVGPDNVARRAPGVEPILLPSGKPLVPNCALSFEQGKSKRPYGRLWWDETVSTLVTFPHVRSMAMLHPEQDRTLTLREYARLQGFPDRYGFCGTIKERYCQIGNAVSVPVARALGYALGTAWKKAGGDPHDEPLMVLPAKFSFMSPSSPSGDTIDVVFSSTL